MTRTRRAMATVAGATLIAATLVLGVGPSSAATVTVSCSADDSVLQGAATINGAPLGPQTSQGALDLVGAGADPPIPAPVSISTPITGSVPAGSVAPGATSTEFQINFELDPALTAGLASNGVTAINLSNMAVTMAAGSGVTGPNVTANPSNTAVNPASPTFPGATFTETFDVTAPVGGTASWDLVSAQAGVNFTIPPSATIPGTVVLTFGLSCTPVSGSGPLISSLVLPPADPDGPVVAPIAVTTEVDTPIDVDLLAAVSDGPKAPTDPDTLEIIVDPENGSATLGDDGVATFTPDSGFVGETQFAFQICTEPYFDDNVVSVRQAPDQIISCNAATVTVTVEEPFVPAPPTTPTTEPPTSPTPTPTPTPTPPPASAQPVRASFTG